MNAFDKNSFSFSYAANDYVELHEENTFLGYDCSYSNSITYMEQLFNSPDDFDTSLIGYSIYITSKNDFDKCVSDVNDYIKSLSYKVDSLLSFGNKSLSNAYLCKDSKGNDYVIIPYIADSPTDELKELYGDKFIELNVIDFDSYSKNFLVEY